MVRGQARQQPSALSAANDQPRSNNAGDPRFQTPQRRRSRRDLGGANNAAGPVHGSRSRSTVDGEDSMSKADEVRSSGTFNEKAMFARAKREAREEMEKSLLGLLSKLIVLVNEEKVNVSPPRKMRKKVKAKGEEDSRGTEGGLLNSSRNLDVVAILQMAFTMFKSHVDERGKSIDESIEPELDNV